MKIYFANGVLRESEQEGSFVHITELMGRLQHRGHDVLLGSEYTPIGRPISTNRWVRIAQALSSSVLYYRFHGLPVPYSKGVLRLRKLARLNLPVVWEVNATPELLDRGPRYEQNISRISLQAKEVDLAICNTPALQRYCHDIGIKNTAIVPLGADVKRFQPGKVEATQDTKKRCLWMGNPAIAWHDLNTIWRAAEILHERHSQIEIHIAVPSLERVPSCPPECVTVHEGIPHSEMPEFVSQFDVGLAIYQNEAAFQYGVFSSPLKVFEYMSASLIPVCSEIEQTRDVIEHGRNGFLLRDASPIELVQTLEHIFCVMAHHERHSVGAAARQRIIDGFSWDRVADDTELLLNRVTQRPGKLRIDTQG